MPHDLAEQRALTASRYIVYRSLVSIVAQHVRPQSDDDDLEARRVLTVALNKLSQADGHQYRAQMGL